MAAHAGFAGQFLSFDHCVNAGRVTGCTGAGGVAGSLLYVSPKTDACVDCCNLGEVRCSGPGVPFCGAFVGEAFLGRYANCFWGETTALGMFGRDFVTAPDVAPACSNSYARPYSEFRDGSVCTCFGSHLPFGGACCLCSAVPCEDHNYEDDVCTNCGSGATFVEDICADLPSEVFVGDRLQLSGTVSPSSSSYKDIIWSVSSGSASLDGNSVEFTTAGQIVLTATIKNACYDGSDFIKRFTVTARSTTDYDIGTAGSTYSDRLLIAQSGTSFSVRYNGTTSYCATDSVITITGASYIDSNYFGVDVRSCTAPVNLCLSDCTIRSSMFPLSIEDAKVNLTLRGANTLTATSSYGDGIRVTEGSAVTIDGTGNLNATGGAAGVGIGSSVYMGFFGDVTINGGAVAAVGAESAAGLGGSYYASGGTITINGGSIVAKGGVNAAGLGGGRGGSVAGIAIHGGSVTAVGNSGSTASNEGGAGIGTGMNGHCAGGSVTATGGFNSARIGAGDDGSITSIDISGGTIVSSGHHLGAGIGGCRGGSGGSIVITGGNIKATSASAAKVGSGGNISVATPVINGAGAAVAETYLTISGLDANIAITSINCDDGYNLNDVKTLDKGHLYFYLPIDSAMPDSIVAGDVTYYHSGSGVYSPHAHNYTYAANGNEITETCSCGYSATATVTAPADKVYDNFPYGAAEVSVSDGFAGRPPTAKYVGRDGTSYESDEPPTNAGKYSAQITMGSVTASANFEITLAPLDVALIVTKVFPSWDDFGSLDFTFNLKEGRVDDLPVPKNTSLSVSKDSPSAEFIITFAQLSQYAYTVSEVNGGSPGVTYDTTAHQVVVTVSDNGTNHITSTVSYEGRDTLTIDNTFSPAEITLKWPTQNESDTRQLQFKADSVDDATLDGDSFVFEYTTTGTFEVTLWKKAATIGGAYPEEEITYTVTVSQADDATNALTATWTAKLTKPTENTTTFTYSGSGQIYSPDGFNSSTMSITGSVPTNAGKYPVTVSLKDKTNYTWADGSTDDITFTFTINKANSSVTNPPAPTNPTYTGVAQALVQNGLTLGGDLQFSLSENGDYSTNIPTGTDAGNYTVYYKVVGDSNHRDTEPASVSVTISKADQPAPTGLQGEEESNVDVHDGKIINVDSTMEYKKASDSNYTAVEGTEITQLEAGTYHVRYKEKANYTPSSNYVTIEIKAHVHSWDEGIVDTDPTCTEKGKKKFTCHHNSAHTKTEAIDALGHDLSDKVISEPEAEKLGEVHSVCSRCSSVVASWFTLKDGASPTMYPDGTRISDASYTPKAGGPFNWECFLNNQT